jgi:hypothetical protein
MTISEINSKLKIVNIKGRKFKVDGIGYIEVSKGFAFYVPELGYLKFECDKTYVPYVPVGGRKACQEILDAGGMVNFEGIEWLREM